MIQLPVKKKKKKKVKITSKLVLKWILIAIACIILIIGCIARVYHYYTLHYKS